MNDSPQYSRLSFWLTSHLRALFFALGELSRAPFQSLATLLVIAIAMALPIGFYTLLGSTQKMSQHWHNQPSITLYLKKDISSVQTDLLIKQLQANPKVQQAQYISPNQGLAQFAKVARIENVLGSLKNNPLPAVIVITPIRSQQSPAHITALRAQLPLNNWVASAQVDQLWVKRFYYLMTIAKRVCYALAIVFGLGVILITGNTIRLSLQKHCQEISLLRLIGATASYIIRPMLYRGLLYGLLGGAIALLLVTLLFRWLANPISQFAATYADQVNLHLLSASFAWVVIAICGLLGLVGAWVASRQFLRQTLTA
ncbi:MAG: permease-like cell division protein FtsX [Coxiellaceae bacterium]|nr:permease-like cell division protein FtsX [Coxiellaceae bacterium]